MTTTAIQQEEIELIAEGKHRDAFGVLGPHESEIRAWLPQAESAFAVTPRETVAMERIGPAGFFAVTLTQMPERYRIRILLPTGEQQEFEDPYRFPPLLTAFELHLHGEGTNYESYRTLGAQLTNVQGVEGVRFAVWAPNAEVVSVVGDFNQWDRTRHPMRLRDGGIWEMFLPGLGAGANYKYSVLSREGGEQQKSDPYGFFAEVPPRTASIVWPRRRPAAVTPTPGPPSTVAT